MIGTLKRALSIKPTTTAARVEVENPETGCKGATWLSSSRPRRPSHSRSSSRPERRQPIYDGPHHASPDRCRCLTTSDVTQDVLRAHAEWLLARGLLAGGAADVGPLILRLILRLPVPPELALPPEAFRDKSVRVNLPPGEVFPLSLGRKSAELQSFPPLDESDLMLG